MVMHGLTKDHERNKKIKVYYSWVLEELHTAYLKDAAGR